MGKPSTFSEANFTWRGWPADKDRPGVADLPAWKTNGQTVSCWRMSWRERLYVLFTGRVWLHIIGRQPPVRVDGRSPFNPTFIERVGLPFGRLRLRRWRTAGVVLLAAALILSAAALFGL